MKLKDIFTRTGLLTGIICLFASCTDELAELNKGYDTLTLTADKQEISLKEADATQTAVTLTWTSGTNYGTGARLNYTLTLDNAAGNTRAEPLFDKRFNDQELSYSFSVRELNDYLHNAGISLNYGETLDVRVVLTAEVAGYEEYTQTSSLTLKVTTYEPVSETLYLCVDAANAEEPNDMSALSLENNQQPGIFSIVANLTAGEEFKFFTERDFTSTAYVRAADSGTNLTDGSVCPIVRKTDGSVEDLNFTVSETELYKLTVNLLDNTLSVLKSEPLAPAYDMIYFVGSFNNWSFDPMKKDPVNPFVFLYSRYFEWVADGEFKFGTMPGSWDNMYMATQDKAPYTDQNVKLGGADQKWVLKEGECGKVYKIRLDITDGKETMTMTPFTPYPDIYLIGDATPAGWNLPSNTPMEKVDDFTFKWTGDLNAGEIKFSCDNRNDWMGAWFMAVEGGEAFTPGDHSMYLIDKTNPDYGYGNLDNKWKVTEAGNYTVTLNQATETLNIVKN